MMDVKQLKRLLSLGEGQSVEFKSSCKNVEVIGQIVCGFLNEDGGYLVCGVGGHGEITGVSDPQAAVAEIERDP